MAELLYDEFKILSKKDINNDDIVSLTKLYMPLIGIDSYSLYITLSSLEKNKNYTFKSLVDMLNFNTLKSVNSACVKLQGIGLIKEYKNKDNNYAFVLNKPLSIEEFLKDEALRVLLESEIGPSEVEKLLLSDIDLTGYKDITKKFEDVFEIRTTDNNSFVKDLLNTTVEIKNEEFNYSLFKMLIDTSFLSEEILDDINFKNNILRLSFVYKLNEEQMKDVVIKSLDINKDLSYTILSKNCKYAFNENYKAKLPTLDAKEKDNFMDSIKDDEIAALVNRLESMAPTEVLETLSGIKPSISEIKMFDELASQTAFTIGAINFMIMVVNSEKEGVLPGIEYFNKIANTWARAKVKNAYDAIKFVEKQKEAKTDISKKSNPRNKKEVKKPSWYEEYKNELDKKEKVQEENQDTSKILEEAKKLFGE